MGARARTPALVKPNCRTPAWLLGAGLFLDHHLDVGGNVLVQPDRHRELAQALKRLMELDLAAVHVEAVALKSGSNVARSNRTKQLVVLARTTLDGDAHVVKLLGESFGFSFVACRAAYGCRLHLLDDGFIALAGFDGELAGQEEIASVALSHADHVAARSEFR